MALWTALHLAVLIVAAVLLAQANQGYKDDIETFKAAALLGTDAANKNLPSG